ncbi:MAG: hypothetical protein KGZ85_03185 [Ignavibacterium sp.]|nr:hypothetical protein [Ignavibacterium sp.]
MSLYRGGDGSTKEKAIIILANSEYEGVSAEWDYLQDKFGTWDLEEQTFLEDGNRRYDIMKIIYHLGQKRKEVWFDVSDFYGRE